MSENLILMLAAAVSLPLLLMTAAVLSARARRRELLLRRGRHARFVLPSAQETARSIRRFHAAVERAVTLDLAWERYSMGRGLLVEDMRRAAKRRARSSVPRAPIPRWV